MSANRVTSSSCLIANSILRYFHNNRNILLCQAVSQLRLACRRLFPWSKRREEAIEVNLLTFISERTTAAGQSIRVNPGEKATEWHSAAAKPQEKRKRWPDFVCIR